MWYFCSRESFLSKKKIKAFFAGISCILIKKVSLITKGQTKLCNPKLDTLFSISTFVQFKADPKQNMIFFYSSFNFYLILVWIKNTLIQDYITQIIFMSFAHYWIFRNSRQVVWGSTHLKALINSKANTKTTGLVWRAQLWYLNSLYICQPER